MNKPTKLFESLFILHKCNSTISRLWSLIDNVKEQIHKYEDYTMLFSYHMQMEVVSYQDEFNGAFSHVDSDFTERVFQVKRIVKPVWKRINKWKDIRSFRNNIIAHPWRNDGNFIIPDIEYYNIPRNWFELNLLADYMTYIHRVVQMEFDKEFIEGFVYIASLQPPQKHPVDYSNINIDLQAMSDEVNALCEEFNKPYSLFVNGYKFKNDSNE